MNWEDFVTALHGRMVDADIHGQRWQVDVSTRMTLELVAEICERGLILDTPAGQFRQEGSGFVHARKGDGE